MTLRQLRTITIADASAQLKSVSPDMLRRWCIAGRVRYFQEGPHGTYHIVESDLVQFIAQQLKGGVPLGDDEGDAEAADAPTPARNERTPRAEQAATFNRRDISDLLPPPAERVFSHHD